MARAKRTDRAEARRRYRTEVAARGDAADDESASAAGDARPAPRGAGATSAEATRPGFLDGLRASMRLPNLRADLEAAPGVLRAQPLLWIPIAIVVVTGVICLVPGTIEYNIPQFLATTFLFPPPLIAPFLAGLIAPRASWLFGLITALISAVMFSILISVVSLPTPTLTPQVRGEYILYALLTTLFGALVGGFAGFYRRFLRTTSPARQGNRSRRSTARPRR